MTEILKQAIEEWKKRGYEVFTYPGFREVVRGNVRFWLHINENRVVIDIAWPMKAKMVLAKEYFGENLIPMTIAKVNEWLDVIDGAESGEIVRRIVEVRNTLQTVPLSPDIVKHKAAVEAMEYLVKRLMGGDGA